MNMLKWQQASMKACQLGIVDILKTSSECEEYQMSFGMWRKFKSMFLTINFLTRQILGIVEYHIETKRIFSHDGFQVH